MKSYLSVSACVSAGKKCHASTEAIDKMMSSPTPPTEKEAVAVFTPFFEHCSTVCETCEPNWGAIEKTPGIELKSGELSGECSKFAAFKAHVMSDEGDNGDLEKDMEDDPMTYKKKKFESTWSHMGDVTQGDQGGAAPQNED